MDRAHGNLSRCLNFNLELTTHAGPKFRKGGGLYHHLDDSSSKRVTCAPRPRRVMDAGQKARGPAYRASYVEEGEQPELPNHSRTLAGNSDAAKRRTMRRHAGDARARHLSGPPAARSLPFVRASLRPDRNLGRLGPCPVAALGGLLVLIWRRRWVHCTHVSMCIRGEDKLLRLLATESVGE